MTDRPECFSLSSWRPLTISCRFCSLEHKLHGSDLMPALVEQRSPALGVFYHTDSKVLVPGIISQPFYSCV